MELVLAWIGELALRVWTDGVWLAVAPAVAPTPEVVEKWARRVGGAAQDYVTGAERAGDVWQRASTAADNVYRQAVTAAAGAGRYSKGIAKSGAQRFTRGVRDKGAVRFGPGAAAAQADFSSAIAPVLDVIRGVDLPPRGPRSGEGNLGRVSAITKALFTFGQRALG